MRRLLSRSTKLFVGGCLAVGLSLFVTTSADAYVYCAGPVSGIEIASGGLLKVNWGYGTRNICFLNADTASPTTVVPQSVCQAIYADVLSSYFSGKNFAANFSSSTTCAAAVGAGPWPAEQPYSFTTQ